MRRIRFRHLGVSVFLMGLVAAGILAAGAVSAKPTAARAAANGDVHMRFNLQRFQINRARHRLVAVGNVVASYRSGGRVLGTTSQRTTLSVAAASTCRVLHLELGQLRLQLLGLIVSLTPVTDQSIVLDISARSDEALGKLFCQVLNAVQGASTTGATTTTATRKLGSAIAKRSQGGVMNFDIPLRSGAVAATTTGTTTTGGGTIAPGQCEVLDLVLGPLNLDLLGLVVQLNEVELNVSANPVGTLGTLFCQLAGSTTTPGTTT
jgi:hypothetical protein